MSLTTGKRKRARKACLPCHQRKRKCDTVFPCSMCTTYGYTCRYDDDTTVNPRASGNGQVSPSATRVGLDNEPRPRQPLSAPASSPRTRSRIERAPRDVDGSSTKSPAAGMADASSPGIFDAQKFRHSGASAAMAFPHILGLALGSDCPPKTRSFAYNFGIRPEEASRAHCFLGDLISEEDLGLFSGVYFAILGPVGDVMDPRIYAQRCRDYYQSSGLNALAFAAVAAGVAALGSFLSAHRHPRESDLVQYAKAILDDPASLRLHGIDHILAWGMRVLYLRATTRPSNAWIASCTQLHLCEAIGLHEEENIKKMASIAGAASLGHDADRLRRIFWISWAGHVMLSYEYDRSPVHFRSLTCGSIIAVPGSIADQFVRLIQIIPCPNSPFQSDIHPSNASDELCERLKSLDDFQTTHPFLVMTKAEIAFCFYRRLYMLKTRIPDSAISLIITSGNAAVAAAQQQARQGRLFWNVIGSVFQYACILLAIESPIAGPHITGAFQGLENLVRAADTVLTREALSIARHLLGLKRAKKRRELEVLEGVEEGYTFFPELGDAVQAGVAVGVGDASNGSGGGGGVLEVDWELDWDQFFVEPYLSMLGPDLPL